MVSRIGRSKSNNRHRTIMSRETFQILPSKTRNSPASRGFTLIELIVVLAVIAMLATLLLPAFANAKQKPKSVLCLNNLRQMTLAALQYANDNYDVWVPNQPGQLPEWVAGLMSWNAANTDNTNLALLTNLTVS